MKFSSTLVVSLTCVVALLMTHYWKYERVAEVSYSRRGLDKVAANAAKPQELTGAIEDLQTALQVDPKDAAAAFGLGWAHQLQNRTDEAFNEYMQALAGATEICKFSHYNLSFLKQQKNDLIGALQEVQASSVCDPTFALAKQREESLRQILASTVKTATK